MWWLIPVIPALGSLNQRCCCGPWVRQRDPVLREAWRTAFFVFPGRVWITWFILPFIQPCFALYSSKPWLKTGWENSREPVPTLVFILTPHTRSEHFSRRPVLSPWSCLPADSDCPEFTAIYVWFWEGEFAIFFFPFLCLRFCLFTYYTFTNYWTFSC